MSANSGGARASWSGKWAFILAAAASAIGLGNLWRFPYLAAKYGGGVFLITYVVLVVTFGFTLMMLEAALGRKTGQSALGALDVYKRQALGRTRATMAGTEGCHPARGSGSRKAGPSSDWGLQPAPMKSELLVIADQHAAVNAFPGLVHTARHTTRVVCTRSRRPNRKGGGAEGVEGEGGEVVTR